MADSAELLKQLEHQKKKLNLIAAIDKIRDTENDPASMLSAITILISDELDIDLCMLMLVDRESGELELKAATDRGQYLMKVGRAALKSLSEQALRAESITLWSAEKVLPELGVIDPPPMQLVGISIRMGAKTLLGAMLMGRKHGDFTPAEQNLMHLIEDHLDSAIVQGYLYIDLQRRNKELEMIYRVDRIRDKHLPFDEMLTTVLKELRHALQTEMAFVLLYEASDDDLELRAVSHDDLFRSMSYQDMIYKLAKKSLETGKLEFDNDPESDIKEVMCLPLILEDEVLGVIGVGNRYVPGGFDENDMRLMMAIASQMDTAIFENLARRKLRRVLGRSVDPQVMETILANRDTEILKGHRAEISVLFCDLRGSTALAERTDPELLVGFINEYLGEMADVIMDNKGTLDKFIGDEVMALFGAPTLNPQHALQAVHVALAMQMAHAGVMARWKGKGVDSMPVGIGIASGELIIGEIGSANRTDYTAIGPAVNLASRITNEAQGGQVLISEATYTMIKDNVVATPVEGLQFKGVEGAVTAYHVTAMKDGKG